MLPARSTNAVIFFMPFNIPLRGNPHREQMPGRRAGQRALYRHCLQQPSGRPGMWGVSIWVPFISGFLDLAVILVISVQW
jgi:hypothetical protein